MTLNELADNIEGRGYQMQGRTMVERKVLEMRVLVAPLVLIPDEPPVEDDCVMVPDWLVTKEPLTGYARIEGAAALGGGVIIHLQFIPVVIFE